MNSPTNPSRSQARDLFLEALEKHSPVERAVFLDEACAGDAGLRKAVEELLAHDHGNGCLENPAMSLPTVLMSPAERTGGRIGRYKLLQQIGEGGFGTVWMAEQVEPVARRVALKIIKLGMETREVIARFEAERQALAMMDHPNIAKVFDAGATDNGRPFFVMELVRGIKITDYCDQANLRTEERLALFIQTCHAIQHAHQKGIIHRDIKPSNVLVTLHDGVPVPKVIDFGVAKATQSQRLTDLTLFTHFEQMIGTPLYMSPEQAEMSGLDIDTRSDIYSLGVLLYELLTGRTPFDPKEMMRKGYDEIRRAIREQEPQAPSRFLKTMADETRATVALHRQSDPIKLTRAVRGDLDWIVMKALEKDRTRRYETANGLAKDIERHLTNEPIAARPPSSAYRFRKLVRRNKLAFSATVLVAFALIGGLGFSTWAFWREQAQRREADQHRQTAKINAEQALANAQQALANAEQASAKERHAQRLLYASDIALAQQALELGNMGHARRLLDRHRPQAGKEDLRGWEWRLLWQQCRAEGFSVLTKGPDRAFSVSFSRDGRRLAVGYFNGRVELWDVQTRTLTKVLQEEAVSGIQAHVAFSPIADALAAGEGGVVKWFDLGTGHERVVTKLPGWVRDLTVSADGKRLAIRTSGIESAIIVDPVSGEIERTIALPPGSSDHCNHARLSPDREHIYVTFGAGNEPKLRCYRISDGKIHWEKNGRDPVGQHLLAGFSALTISPNGKVLASAMCYTGKTIQLWSAASGERLGTLEGHTDYVCSLAFSPDGKVLASASSDQTIRVWDTGTWQESGPPLRGHGDEVHAVAWTPDGKTLATGARDRMVFVWSAQAQKAVGGRQMLPKEVRMAWALPDSRTLLLSDSNKMSLIDLETLQVTNLPFAPEKYVGIAPGSFLGVQEQPGFFQLHELTASGATLIAELPITLMRKHFFAYSRENRLLAWTADAKAIHLTSLDRPHEQVDLPSDGETMIPVRFSADGLFLLAEGADKAAQVWDLLGQSRLPGAEAYFSPFSIPVMGEYWNALRSDTGDILCRWIANASSPTALNRPSLPNQTKPKGFWPEGQFTDRAYSPDGRTFAVTTMLGTATLYDAHGLEKLATLRGGQRSSVPGAVFYPDGSRLVTAGDVLWDMVTRQPLLKLPAKGTTHFSACFTADGSTLIVGSPHEDGSFSFWRAPSWETIQVVERAGAAWPPGLE